MKSLYPKIIELLSEKNVEYTVTEHEPVFTSEEAAKVRGMDLASGAKAMVCVADAQPLLFVLTGNKKIDTKTVKKLLSVRDFRFATHSEVQQLTTVEIGAVPPLGSCMGLKTYCDDTLSSNEYISFNPGSHTHSITMPYNVYIAIENPILCHFSL